MIIGHQKIRNELDRALEKDTLSHAYIFSGPEAVGKFSLALELAAKINQTEKKIDSDLLVISPKIEETKGIKKNKNIAVEEIRDLGKKIVLLPEKEKKRIAIIREAERLTKGAQNAILKTLEEAPERAILILVTQNIFSLLPTFVSRCQVKKFSILTDEEMGKMISFQNKNWEEIIFWSFGRPGWAKEMLEDESKIKEKKEILERLLKAIRSDVNERFDLAENLAKKEANLFLELGVWEAILREEILGKKNFGISRKRALEIIETIEESKKILETTNANARLVLENLFLKF